MSSGSEKRKGMINGISTEFLVVIAVVVIVVLCVALISLYWYKKQKRKMRHAITKKIISQKVAKRQIANELQSIRKELDSKNKQIQMQQQIISEQRDPREYRKTNEMQEGLNINEAANISYNFPEHFMSGSIDLPVEGP